MLNRGISYITFFFLISCTNSKNTGNLTTELKSKSKTIIGESNYDAVLNRINDTILSWKLNRLRDYTENESQYRVDSLLCFNTNRNRLITCLIGKALIKPNPTGGITFMLGEKISNEWYFFKSSHIFIPYELKKIKDGEPFEFEELHEIALKEVYGGYLNEKGEINEAWFTSLFEGPGWGDFENQESSLKFLNVTEKFTDKRNFFEAIHLQSVKNNWASRDTTKPIISLQRSL